MHSPQFPEDPYLPPSECEPPLKAAYRRLGRSGKLSLWFGIAQTVMIFAVMVLALWQSVPMLVLVQNAVAGLLFAAVLWHCAHAKGKAFLLLALLYLFFAFGFFIKAAGGWWFSFDFNLPIRLSLAFGGDFDGFSLRMRCDILALLAAILSLKVWAKLRHLPPLPEQPCPEAHRHDYEFDDDL